MFLCVCNALNDKMVRQAVADGARSCASVFGQFGCRPQCGKCIPYIRQMINSGHIAACGEARPRPTERISPGPGSALPLVAVPP